MSAKDHDTPPAAQPPSPAHDAFPEEYFIHAGSSPADVHSRVIKHGDSFAVFDQYGDVRPAGLGEEGIYHAGTRFVSTSLLAVNGQRPLLLSCNVGEEHALLSVDLTNPDLCDGDGDGAVVLPSGSLHISRSKFLWQACCYERMGIRNFSERRVRLRVAWLHAADFVDLFEVRGMRRTKRGRDFDPRLHDDGLTFRYLGLDEVMRGCRIRLQGARPKVEEKTISVDLELAPGQIQQLDLRIELDVEPATAERFSYLRALVAAERAQQRACDGLCDIYTSNELFNDWINRSAADLRMLTTELDSGPYPYAGTPWFSTPFGRDGLITAFACLWANPGLARGVLRFLAKTQAEHEDDEQDAEPGKILHEMRHGEMAALGEIPFRRYYGTVDATPLFVLLASAYHAHTGDLGLVRDIWPAVRRALAWIERWGDRDGDGFVEYHRRSAHGLANQGWKDSHDAVFHADGSSVSGPVALCEVQAYVYGALTGAAQMAGALGEVQQAEGLRRRAEELRARFEEQFWCEELGAYALALDGDKRRCEVLTSNAGQCLFTGIASTERARRMGSVLVSAEMFSGWGIRTLAQGSARYNPMSYHNGSIWPHDNALVALGLARYGLKDEVLQVLTGLFDASLYFDLRRLPELFCGFARTPGATPTQYPVACLPQAWAAASVYMLIAACAGMEVRGDIGELRFNRPSLPPSLREVRLRKLAVGAGEVDVVLQRHGDNDVGVSVLRREGTVRVVVIH